MKNLLKAIIHSVELLGIMMLAFSTGSIPIVIAALIPSLTVASRLLEDINGNKINDSIFAVYKSGKIIQNSFSHPLKMLSIVQDKEKGKRFVEEAASMFAQMDVRDKKGNLKKYKTKSQAKTLFLLKQLKRNGYIENLEYKPAGKTHLIVEKIEMGNTKGMNKKHQMYQISFNLTDKVRTKEDLINLTEKKETPKEETVNYNNIEPELKKEETVINNIQDHVTQEEVKHDATKEELLEFREKMLNYKEKEAEMDKVL